jgi:RNA polymerase sigma-70 factor (ECF subfamily)
LALAPRFEFDADYVARLTAGDAATERHFTTYFGRLLRLKLRSRLKSATAIEDVTQETFLRVFTALRRKGGLQSAGGLGAFVNTVCNNILFETYRSQTRQQQNVTEDDVPLEAPGRSVESTLIGEDERARVRRTIAELPAKDQELIRALFFEERDKDEICRSLGVDRQYLRVLLHRARNRFRDLYIHSDTMAAAVGTAETDEPA